MSPATSNLAPGLVVPIPVFPSLSKYILVTLAEASNILKSEPTLPKSYCLPPLAGSKEILAFVEPLAPLIKTPISVLTSKGFEGLVVPIPTYPPDKMVKSSEPATVPAPPRVNLIAPSLSIIILDFQ